MKYKVKDKYDELLKKMYLFKGDKFSKAHISELFELIDLIYEKALMYEDLCH